MSETYEQTTRTDEGSAINLIIDRENVVLTRMSQNIPQSSVAMTRRQAKELVERLIVGLAQTDNAHESDAITDFAALFTLLFSLDSLREIADDNDIALRAAEWQSAMEAGTTAQEHLAALVDDAFEELSSLGERALVENEEEDLDDEEDEEEE